MFCCTIAVTRLSACCAAAARSCMALANTRTPITRSGARASATRVNGMFNRAMMTTITSRDTSAVTKVINPC